MKPGATTRPVASISVRPRRGSVEIAAIVLPVMPTLRTASRPDAGSSTRPLRRTMSYGGAAACAASSAEHTHTSTRIAVTSRLLLVVGLGGLLFPARAAQDVAQAVVAFVAGEFVDRAAGPDHRIRRGPRPRPRRGILDREAVLDRVRVEARDAFHEMEIRAGAPEVRF